MATGQDHKADTGPVDGNYCLQQEGHLTGTCLSVCLSVSRIKVKVMSICIARGAYTWNISKALRYNTHCQGISQFLPACSAFHAQAKWAIPASQLSFQPQLVLKKLLTNFDEIHWRGTVCD